MQIAQIDPLNVEVIAPVSMFGMVELGMSAEVRPEAPIGGVYHATVSIVDQIIDAPSGTFSIRLLLTNADEKLPAGLRCKSRFIEKQTEADS